MSQKFEEYRQEIDKISNDQTKPWFPLLQLVESKTGVAKSYVFIGIIAIIALYLAFGWAAQILCNAIAVAYPAYTSMKAIETSDKKDDTKWLTYWVVFACFTLLEHFSSLIVQIIPFYWLIKCIFYIWCFAPIPQNGSATIYNRLIRPYFLKHEKTADDLLGKAMGNARNLVENVIKKD